MNLSECPFCQRINLTPLNQRFQASGNRFREPFRQRVPISIYLDVCLLTLGADSSGPHFPPIRRNAGAAGLFPVDSGVGFGCRCIALDLASSDAYSACRTRGLETTLPCSRKAEARAGKIPGLEAVEGAVWGSTVAVPRLEPPTPVASMSKP
jgi:hypothetical protein